MEEARGDESGRDEGQAHDGGGDARASSEAVIDGVRCGRIHFLLFRVPASCVEIGK